ncbi:APG_G0022600.mRNA.1.CDS.1 [Saccharomyces cerevisiae]|uniref:ATP-dependent 6-phosphofructokinase n=1 Tax=Saccharomyces cerevisiae (strain JAY291) TaxID=574961 RepID=C7GNI9_YEAS2|nr:Pfk1p [Saccharomyces cerevisiae JAY291]CAI4514847.1 APG_G0022600.mRNA.1.CDS.1 [Saccharomyces cerevisiae]CAI7138955.1 APG_G0022600.mRNA.1.CDS.1 [Saccharomyces cerevisiae]
MQSQDSCYGVAFRSIITNDEALFKKTIHFYHTLGFATVKDFNKFKHGENSLLSSGTSQDSLREVWLESFKLSEVDASGFRIPQQEATNKAQSQGALLKIRLVMSAPIDETFDTNETATITYFSTDLNKIVEKFPKQAEKLSDTLVFLKDPMGNNITFSGLANATDSAPTSKDAFLEATSEDEIISRASSDASDLLRQTLGSSQKKKKIAVMTSGGDSPGMNAAVRAVVRTGIHFGCDVFAVYEGYEGLLRGGKYLKKMAWEDVRGWLSEGGTLIGTARSMEFRKREGRRQAAGNLISQGIDALVVCGGDGSLTGADLFRHEWPSLVDELVAEGRFTKEEVAPYKNLSIVGLVGSIDNDMSGTDSTIGAYSALERICEMVDYIDATAKSHSRAFVVEVMGRHCGWLALMAGIATGADYIFIPERAVPHGKWQDELKEVCQRHRSKGRRNNTIIVAEGALDDQLNPVTANDVKDALIELGLDTKVTILGHVQRGGTAVAHDRWLATLQGVDAVKAVLEFTPETPSPLIGILENKIIRMPLVESVKLTKSVATAIENKDFDKAISLRDTEFIELYENFLSTTVKDDGSELLPVSDRLNIGIVHVGAPSAALNAATRAATLYCLSHGHKPYAIMNGFSGLIQTGEVKELSWIDVENWHNLGGSEIGTNRSVASEDLGTIAYYFQKNKLDGLIILGGFEGFRSLKQLRDGRTQHPIFNIPMCLIPATVSNNVPGTEYSLGVDTCLNALVNYTDDIKQSASATRRRVFVCEVQGGHSGYIASFTGLITGAVSVYTPEKKIDLASIREDITLLKENFRHDKGENRNGELLVRNEQASSVYSTQLLADIISEASKGKFGVRTAIPGHVQQGGVPSSKDRVTASRFAVKCIKFIEQWNKKNEASPNTDAKVLRFKFDTHGEKVPTVEHEDDSAAVICVNGSHVSFKPIANLWENETNVELRKGFEVHWAEYNKIGDILSGRLKLRAEVAALAAENK